VLAVCALTAAAGFAGSVVCFYRGQYAGSAFSFLIAGVLL
jgi:hypothetical protein